MTPISGTTSEMDMEDDVRVETKLLEGGGDVDKEEEEQMKVLKAYVGEQGKYSSFLMLVVGLKTILVNALCVPG